jgi:hypothetical protein
MATGPPELSLHDRLVEAIERGARAQALSHALIGQHGTLDANLRSALAELDARRREIRAAREQWRSLQSDT